MTQEEAEQEALRILKRRMREGRRVPRRHMLLAYLVILPAFILLIIVITMIFGDGSP